MLQYTYSIAKANRSYDWEAYSKVNSGEPAPTQEYFNKLRELSHIPKTGRHFPYIPASHKEDFVLCKEGKGDQLLEWAHGIDAGKR